MFNLLYQLSQYLEISNLTRGRFVYNLKFAPHILAKLFGCRVVADGDIETLMLCFTYSSGQKTPTYNLFVKLETVERFFDVIVKILDIKFI